MFDYAQKYMGKLGIWLLGLTLFFSLFAFFVSPIEFALINLIFNILAVFPILFRPMETKLEYFKQYSSLVLISCLVCFLTRFWINNAIGRYFDAPDIQDGAIFINNFLFINIFYFYILYYSNAFLKMFGFSGKKRALVVVALLFVAGYFVVFYSSVMFGHFLQLYPNFLEQTPNYPL